MDLVRFLGCEGSVHLHQPVALLHFDEATQLDDELMARLFVVDFEGLHRDLLANGGIETMSHHAACALAELPVNRDQEILSREAELITLLVCQALSRNGYALRFETIVPQSLLKCWTLTLTAASILQRVQTKFFGV